MISAFDWEDDGEIAAQEAVISRINISNMPTFTTKYDTHSLKSMITVEYNYS